MKNKKAILFINGKPPLNWDNINTQNTFVVCTDGAYNYLPFEPEVIIGDLDSLNKNIKTAKVIQVDDQNSTDFDKALKYIIENGYAFVQVYGASGGEQDHFLGNLSSAKAMKNKIEIEFIDEYSTFFFAKSPLELKDVKGRIISLFPFPKAKNISTTGLQYPLQNENLTMGKRIGIRNQAIDSNVLIKFNNKKSDLIVFVQHKK